MKSNCDQLNARFELNAIYAQKLFTEQRETGVDLNI